MSVPPMLFGGVSCDGKRARRLEIVERGRLQAIGWMCDATPMDRRYVG